MKREKRRKMIPSKGVIDVEQTAKAPSPIVEPAAQFPIVEPEMVSPIVEHGEMAETAAMPESTVNEEMARNASEPEPRVEEMAMKVPEPEPKQKKRRLKKMTTKKSVEKKIVNIKFTTEGEEVNEEMIEEIPNHENVEERAEVSGAMVP